MTFRRLAATASALGAIGWLLLFGPGAAGIELAWLDGLLWAYPLAFGLGTIALYAGGGRRLDRAAAWSAGIVAVVSAASLLAGSLLLTDGAAAYAAWLGFVGGIVVLCGLVVLYGFSHRRDPGDRHMARLALVAGGLPFAFLLVILGYKVATGWWVTDPALVAFGSVGAAVLVGGCWLALGVALWIWPAASASDAEPASQAA
jgi:hypothetical protein